MRRKYRISLLISSHLTRCTLHDLGDLVCCAFLQQILRQLWKLQNGCNGRDDKSAKTLCSLNQIVKKLLIHKKDKELTENIVE